VVLERHDRTWRVDGDATARIRSTPPPA
jgi:hypothetical protein